ncbi:MAG TPA: TetR/AcrR family transcriptional regulator [Sneathiellales bacterium]|jgi:AcrR family transcriptional regulator|nr:TetR/AcrR family transcriptional regulator [Sneathiellales bacterium]
MPHQITRTGQDRAATEAALEDAAMRLLDRNGVLAGLNLREVAAEAGVNRGLVYHYFGSRSALLQRALRRNARERIGAISDAERLPFRERILRYWRTITKYRREVRLVTLLLLDSKDAVFESGEGPQLTPIRKQTIQAFVEDQEKGLIDGDINLDGLHAVIISLVSGYAIYRDELARSAKMPADILDEKVEAIFGKMLEALQTGGQKK